MAKSKRRRYPLDNAVNRLASWPDLLARVLSSLRDPLDVVRASGVCRDWRRAARRDDVWAAHCERCFFHPVPGYHVEVRRCDIGAVPAHAEALRKAGLHRLAFREAFADRRRNWLTRDELCGITWRFRFKRDAGMCDGDPWWNGGAARRNPFRRDGTCGLEPGPSAPHRGPSPATSTASTCAGSSISSPRTPHPPTIPCPTVTISRKRREKICSTAS